MAMNLGFRTRKIFLSSPTDTRQVILTPDAYDLGFGTDGVWNSATYDSQVAYQGGSTGIAMNEGRYIDLGIVTGESEEYSAGNIPITYPGQSADNRKTLNIGMRLLRITISGIIPDGEYVATGTVGDSEYTNVSGKSNASVFRYKVSKYLAYRDFRVLCKKERKSNFYNDPQLGGTRSGKAPYRDNS